MTTHSQYIFVTGICTLLSLSDRKASTADCELEQLVVNLVSHYKSKDHESLHSSMVVAYIQLHVTVALHS